MHQNRRRSGGGPSASRSSSNPSGSGARTSEQQQKRPLVVALNCLEDVSPEQDALAGVATVEHVGLGQVSGGRIESAAVVLVHSLAFLPRAAQRRLQPWQLVLCLGSADRPVDSAIAVELGLRLVHVDAGRAEEVADTVMALLLGLLRRTHLLSRQASLPAAAVAGWLGSIQPLCRGMRRCRGLVLGIVGKSASARCLATRSLAFRISVLYFDVHLDRSSGKPEKCSITFPSAARRMDTLNDLLAASDLISLHCALSEDTVHIINAERLQHIKPGAFIVNTGSSQLIDDCALKQLLLDGTVAGCALDGVEGPQWMEAWVREMPNVLVLPRSADYSEEVWIEIREKAISVLKTFFLDGTVPESAVSDEEDELIVDYNESPVVIEPITGENEPLAKYNAKETGQSTKETLHHSHSSGVTQSAGFRLEGRRSRSGRKSKKRSVRRRSRPKSDDLVCLENEGDSAKPNDQAATSSRDQVQSSSSRFASPEDSRNKPICRNEYTVDSTLDKKGVLDLGSSTKICELLKDGHVIALHPKDETGLLVSRQRVPGGGWILDTVANVTKRDPAAQFLVNFRSKDVMGLRSFSAGGKLLQINRRMEFVFASYSFDVWESWTLEGFQLEQCKLVNCRNPLAVLDVHIEILAAIDEEDGVARWLE